MFTYIKIQNIGPIKELEIPNLDSLTSPVIIMGDNGTGKSTILDCFSYILSGEFPSKAGSVYNRVTYGENSGMVIAKFVHKGKLYRVERTLSASKKKQAASVTVDGVTVAGPLVSEVDKFLEENLVSPEMMLMTNFSSQFRKGDFTVIDPADRKRILSDMIGLRFNEYLPEFQEEKRKNDQKYEQVVSKITALDRELEDDIPHETEAESLRKAIEKCDAALASIKEDIELLEKTRDDADAALASYVPLGERRKELLKTLEAHREVQADGIDISSVHTMYEALTTKLDNTISGKKALETHKSNAVHSINELKAQLQSYRNSAEKLEAVPCGSMFPACHFIKDAFEAKEKLALNESTMLQEITSLTSKITEYNDLLARAETQEAKTRKELDTVLKYKNYPKIYPEITRIDEIAAELEEINGKLNSSQRERYVLQKEDALGNLREEKNRERAIMTERMGLAEGIGKMNAVREQRERIAGTITGLKNESKTLEESQRVLNMIVEGFGVRGIQPLILELSIPEICLVANQLLDCISEGIFSISLKTVQESSSTKKGRETMLIEVQESGGRVGDITEFSGGEQLMISSCLRAALTITNMRNGHGLPFFFGDEVFGAYDAERNRKAIQMYKELSNTIPQVFLISHQAEVFAEAGTSILLTNNGENVTVMVV